MNIYFNHILKYPLGSNEYQYLDDVWNFINIFNRKSLYLHQYRKYLIHKINQKYDIDKFYLYESIANKLFWNLRWLIFPIWDQHNISHEAYSKFISHNYQNYQDIPMSLLMYQSIPYKDTDELKQLIEQIKSSQIYYRSFINKLLMIDPIKKIIYVKKMEGSPHIFYHNYFNLLTSHIMSNRELYEHVMKDPYTVLRSSIIPELYKLPKYYFELDYPFPNINFCVYQLGNEIYQKWRIQKMYFDDHAEKNWFKILKFNLF